MRVGLGGFDRHPVLLAGSAHPEMLARLETFFAVEVVDAAEVAEQPALATRLAGKSALIATQTARVDAALLSGLPHLKAVCKMRPDHADIDLDACSVAGVMATATPDVGEGEAARREMAMVAAENLIAAFGFGRAAGHPANLLNVDIVCMLGCCY